MNHDTAIPQDLHTDARESVKSALGDFWSSVFADQAFVDAELTAKVLSASQLYINVMEALSIRDHRGMPVFHREHWHPMVIRLSQRNTGYGLTVGMRDTPVIGEQPEGGVYLDGEVFKVGGNALYSKVNTYPFTAMNGCPLVNVKTCICDSISAPTHMLVKDRDFSVGDGVFVVRKEQDPFDMGGYRIVQDGDDRIAVLWVCDGEFDMNNVSDFIGYPLGFDVKSTQKAADIISAMWDVVVYGVTPQHLNIALGAMFDVPTVKADTSVEKVTAADDGFSVVVTGDDVYRIRTELLRDGVKAGATLRAGDFLTDELHVYHGLSHDEFIGLVERAEITSLSLPVGSVYGVSETVVVEDVESEMEDGGWFKLNSGDSGTSPFWSAVRSRVSEDDLEALFGQLSGGEDTVNPLRSLGYVSLSNTVLVRTAKGLCADPCAGGAFAMLSRLVPSYASLVVVQRISVDDEMGLGDASDPVAYNVIVKASDINDSGIAAGDSVAFTLVPDAATEV